MAFRTEDYNKRGDTAIQKPRDSVACDCWFTSEGKTVPRFLKYQDSEEIIHKINIDEVCRCEDQFFAGRPMRIYTCRTAYNGTEYNFKLYFYPDKFKWEILWI